MSTDQENRKTPMDQRLRNGWEREKFFLMILETSVDTILVLDQEGIIKFVNPAAESLFDHPVEEMIGQMFGFPVHGMEKTELDISRPGEDSRVVEIRVAKKEVDDETLYIANLRDITEMIRLREKLRAMALVDDLTGAYNRRGFFRLAKQQMGMADRTKKKISLVYADLDHLKEINDTFGHAEGDLALSEIAEILEKTFRKSDIIARIGGDEFVILAVEVLGDTAGILVARLEENLKRRNAKETGGHKYKLSLSIGIAQYDPECPCSLETLLFEADKSMYEHKRSKIKC